MQPIFTCPTLQRVADIKATFMNSPTVVSDEARINMQFAYLCEQDLGASDPLLYITMGATSLRFSADELKLVSKGTYTHTPIVHSVPKTKTETAS